MYQRFAILFYILFISNLFSQRIVQNFNNNWQFLKRSIPTESNEKDWEKITIPHTWNLDAYEKRDYDRNTYWYRKQFQIHENLKGKELYLRFEAVNSYAEVYLNGKKISDHSGGYSAFHVKLPKEILKEQNIVSVKVNNENEDIPPLSGDFTIFGGIYRDVWLIAVEKEHFDLENSGSKGIFISTSNVSEKEAFVSIKGKIENPNAEKLKIKLNIQNKNKTVYAKEFNQKSSEINLENILIETPNLWSPENPNLYLAKIQLIKKNKIVDELEIPFGIRWFSADTKNGFQLNGKPLKLMGTNRHQDKAPLGIAVPNSVHRDDMKLIKEMGANFVRLAHYQQDDEVLKACDSLGLIVWEEAPVVDIISTSEKFKTNAETALKEMIRQHYNHPSVVFWGYMNEVIIQVQYRLEEEKRPEMYRKTVDLAKYLEKVLKAEDPSRLSVMAYHGVELYNEIGLNGIADVAGWNLYQGWYGDNLNDFEKFVDKQHQKFPDIPIIISEFGAGSDKRLHSLKPETFDFSIEYQQKYLEHYLPEIQKRKFVIGATEWNFIDFNVATRQESMPRTNNKGLVYNDRTPKDIFYYFQSFLRKDIPVLHIATDDWKNRTTISDEDLVEYPLKIYSNLKEVSLVVNGNQYKAQSLENLHKTFSALLKKGRNDIKVSGKFNNQIIEKTSEIFLNIVPKTTYNLSEIDIKINVGSNCDFIDENGETWVADKKYEKGSWGFVDGEIFRKSPGRIGTTAEIVGTKNNPLFQTKREKLSTYRFDVPKGKYEIELGFADLYNAPKALAYDLSKTNSIQNSDENLFDVLINGKVVLKDFSPFREVGINKALLKRIFIENKSNSIEIIFDSKTGINFLNSFSITNTD